MEQTFEYNNKKYKVVEATTYEEINNCENCAFQYTIKCVDLMEKGILPDCMSNIIFREVD